MNFVILLAAGSGLRMEGHTQSKCFIDVKNKPIYQYSLETFLTCDEINKVILVVPAPLLELLKEEHANDDKVIVVSGGSTRQESVYHALDYLRKFALEEDLVLIHDAARPLISLNIIKDNIKTASLHDACVTVIPAIDTVLLSQSKDKIDDIPNRKDLFYEQTPATFRYSLILSAHEKALEYQMFDASDDCRLLRNLGNDIYFVNGERNNFKITNEIDLSLFEYLLTQKQ